MTWQKIANVDCDSDRFDEVIVGIESQPTETGNVGFYLGESRGKVIAIELGIGVNEFRDWRDFNRSPLSSRYGVAWSFDKQGFTSRKMLRENLLDSGHKPVVLALPDVLPTVLVDNHPSGHESSSLVSDETVNTNPTEEETRQHGAEQGERAEEQYVAADPTPTPSTSSRTEAAA